MLTQWLNIACCYFIGTIYLAENLMLNFGYMKIPFRDDHNILNNINL